MIQHGLDILKFISLASCTHPGGGYEKEVDTDEKANFPLGTCVCLIVLWSVVILHFFRYIYNFYRFEINSLARTASFTFVDLRCIANDQ